MRSFRLVCALVLAAGLAMLPVSGALAMAHAANVDAGMTMALGDDCPCCKSEKTETCFLKCCHVQALMVDGVEAAKTTSPRFGETALHLFAALALGPDPPPPRS